MLDRWTRWQDWVALVAGLYAILSPLWTETDTMATWTMLALGVLLVASVLWALPMPGAVVSEWTHTIVGALFVAAPWVMGFTGLTMMALTAWIVGGVAVVTGAWAIPYSYRAHGHAAST